MMDETRFQKGLYFVPLGGAEEIGMNFNLYCYDDAWLAIDLGITFSDKPGVDIVLPDPSFLEERKSKLVGLVLTHGHEDHIGAIPYLWKKLQCPIYATPFTRKLVEGKLKDAGLLNQVTIHTLPLSGNVKLGPFDINLVNITHSILEHSLMYIKTPLGTVVHTGDWKFDNEPCLGKKTDEDALAALGEENILAMVCDSTNVFEKKSAGSEAEVFEGLDKIFKAYTHERLVLTCFASNLARVHTIATLAKKYGRKCALAGRSFKRMIDAAQSSGYMNDLPDFIGLDKINKLPREQVVYITTGSQGEERAALSRIAHGVYRDIYLEKEDVIVFSSRRIPGNEKKISQLKNLLVNQGYEVIFPNSLLGDIKLHVSGHPSQEDLVKMYQLIKPKIAIPVHGEAIHLKAHKDLAHTLGVKEVFVPHNGVVIQLAEKSGIVGKVYAGRLLMDGKDLLPENSLILRERQQMASYGSAVITLVFDSNEELYQEPIVTLQGIVSEEDSSRAERILSVVIQDVINMVNDIPYAKREKDNLVEDLVSAAVRKSINRLLYKKPVTDVHIVRI